MVAEVITMQITKLNHRTYEILLKKVTRLVALSRMHFSIHAVYSRIVSGFYPSVY